MEKNQTHVQRLAITQMRRSVEKLGSSAEKYGEATLLRFLVARSMDAEKAAKMFVVWQKWRADFVPLGYIPEGEVSHELEARKVFLQRPTRRGHALLIVHARQHFAAKDQLEFKKFVVHLLDKTIASAIREKEDGNEKLVGVLDLQNISYKNIDARALINGFQFLQSYYPERLAKCYLLSMPWIFVGVWKLVCQFLEKTTLEKGSLEFDSRSTPLWATFHSCSPGVYGIGRLAYAPRTSHVKISPVQIQIVVVSSEEERRAFIEEIGEDALPEEYGGRANLTALQDMTLSHWPPQE